MLGCHERIKYFHKVFKYTLKEGYGIKKYDISYFNKSYINGPKCISMF